MSTSAPAAVAPAAPTEEQQLKQAMAIRDGVYLDGFFSKLAEVGIVPNTDDERHRLIHLGLNAEAIASKEAQAQQFDTLGAAERAVNEKLASLGIAAPPKPQTAGVANDPSEREAAMKIAQAYLSEDVVAGAMMTLASYSME